MTVRYKSTRGGEANLSFEEVVLAGLATDRGLYVPETVPQITMGQLEKVGDSGVVMSVLVTRYAIAVVFSTGTS